MASRNFSRMQALTKEVKVLFAEVTIGEAGAATLGDSIGVASVALAGGVYTITLEDNYVDMLHADIQVEDAVANVIPMITAKSGSAISFTPVAVAVANVIAYDDTKIAVAVAGAVGTVTTSEDYVTVTSTASVAAAVPASGAIFTVVMFMKNNNAR